MLQPSDINLGVDSDGDEHLGDSEPDAGQRAAIDGRGGAAPAPAAEESDGDGDDGGFYDSDEFEEENQPRRRRECELLFPDFGSVRGHGPDAREAIQAAGPKAAR